MTLRRSSSVKSGTPTSAVTTPTGSSAGASFALLGIAGCLFAYVIGVVFSAIFGAIYFAVAAFIYNLVSNWVGGLRLELDLPVTDKAKRDEATGFPV